MRSSYIQNNYGEIFLRTVEIFQPHKVVELGVLDGYSLLNMALGAKRCTETRQHTPIINAYDLWDDYPYNHGNQQEVLNVLLDNGVADYVTLHKRDAFTVHEDYGDHSVCLLHVDLSNDGVVLRNIVDRWDNKINFGGMLMFEGGSVERDQVEWMKKYNKESIRDEINKNTTLNKKYIYATYNAFPSLSVFIKHS